MLVVCFFAQSVPGQPALSRTPIARAQSCMAAADVTAAPVEPAHGVVVAVFADTLQPDELTRFREEVTSLYQAVNRTNPVRLALLLGNNVQFAGPFKTRVLLQSALAEAVSSFSTPTEPPAPLRFYTVLGTVAPQLGSDWSTLILAGHFPAVPPDLAEFTEAWLSERLRAARVRVTYWTPSGEASEPMDRVVAGTGGLRLSQGMASVAAVLQDKGEFQEVSWHGASAGVGFRVCTVFLLGSDGQPAVTVPSLIAASGATVPDIEGYGLLREKIQALAAALQQPQLSAEQAAQAEADLTAALQIGPRQEDVLRLGMALFKHTGNNARLAAVLSALTEIVSAEPGLFSDLGNARYRLADWDGAEAALRRARELKPGDPSVAEELARIRLLRKDDAGALPLLEESLAARAGNQELWLLRADVASRLHDTGRTADSLEHAIALGNVALERRTALIRLYIETHQPERASIHVRAVAANLPPDPAIRGEYAGFFDSLGHPEEALPAWKRALEADPKLESAHYRITKLLIEKNSLPEALQAAEAGIQAAPQSARLYLSKAEVLEKQNRFYDARRTLRDVVAKLPEPAVIQRLAAMEDAGGLRAAHYYRQLLESGEKAGLSADARKTAMDLGLRAALRDGDLDDAAWFRAQPSADVRAATAARSRGGTMAIPGGLAALSFAARSPQSTPDRFLVEYARTAARYLSAANKKIAQGFTESIREHFRRIADLSAFGAPKPGKVTITISLQDKKLQKNGEKVLGLLGWKMSSSRKGVKLEAAEKGARAAHQETASALALNEVGMQEELEAGKPFSFEIPTETARVILGEEAWRTQFYGNEKYPGGLAEAIAGDLRLAQTYAALGQMEINSANVLVSSVGLKTLYEKHAPLLLQYSSALAVEQGHVSVPGGVPAESIWTTLTGASPRQPAPFFRALLAKDEGKLLAYYAALSALDIQHQRFFTRTASRTGKFYELFKDAPETQRATARHIPSGSFVEFLAEVPLASDGSVDFPGSPEVWTVAKGQSRSSGNMNKLLKKLKRAAAPDVEDEILLRLANTRYKQRFEGHTELDNFLAVVRVDQHRSDPLDENSALLLAQHYAGASAAYPYFATLTGLGQKQFEEFFALTETLRGRSDSDRKDILADLSALIEIVCLAQQSGALNEMQSAELFGRIVEGFQNAASAAARTATSLDLVRAILQRGSKDAAADPDAAMRTMLLGNYGSSQIQLEDMPVTVDPSKVRLQQYQQVLEIQKVPSLATVFALADAVRGLGTGKGAAADQIRILDSKAAGLYPPDTPKDLGLKGKEKTEVQGFQPRRLQEIDKQFRDKTAKKKVNPKDLEKLSQDYLEEIDAPVRWALEGIIYAYFLNPDDLLVSEDPLLLRKHQVINLSPGFKSAVWDHAELQQSSENAGSFFTGSFADFGDAAGAAAARSAKLGGEYGESVASKQVTAIRMTNWAALRDEDLRLFGLKVTVAREWIVRAATQPELETALAESTLGLLSLTRRADLLAAMAGDDWDAVWAAVSVSDLYFLGDRYLERYSKDSWKSPAVAALRQLAAHNDGSRLQLLGAELDDLLDCSHPHLWSAPPYEQYEMDLFQPRLAERTAEFKLYLARYADQAGIPAAALAAIAEPAARGILKKLQMSDLHDWHSVLAAYATVDGKVIEGVLSK